MIVDIHVIKSNTERSLEHLAQFLTMITFGKLQLDMTRIKIKSLLYLDIASSSFYL